MPKVTDSSSDIIKMIPDHWYVKRLKYLCTIETGNQDTQDADPNGEYPFYVRSPIIEKSTRFSFNGEGILMAGDGAGAGRIFHHAFGKYAVHQRVYRLANFKNINSQYLFYYLSNIFTESMNKGSAQSTVPSVRLPMLTNFDVCIPPFREQEVISTYLNYKCSEIDTLSADIEKQIETLEQYKQNIITETVTKGLDPNAEMKDSGIPFIGHIPAAWEVKRIKLLGISRNGLTYSPDDLCDINEGTLVLRSSNIQNGKINLGNCIYVNCNIPHDLMVAKGDLLICSRNGSRELIGKNAIIPENLVASFGAFMMIYRTNIPKYMYYILNSSIFNYYLGSFFTTTINQLTRHNFNNMKVPFCENPNEQEQIVNYLDNKCAEIDNIIEGKRTQLDTLAHYKKSLIYEYVTGKKEVPIN